MPATKGESTGKSQEARILRAMRIGWVNPLFALKMFGCFRLGARIYDLKKDGHDIETRMVSRKGKRFAEYRLRAGAKQVQHGKQNSERGVRRVSQKDIPASGRGKSVRVCRTPPDGFRL